MRSKLAITSYKEFIIYIPVLRYTQLYKISLNTLGHKMTRCFTLAKDTASWVLSLLLYLLCGGLPLCYTPLLLLCWLGTGTEEYGYLFSLNTKLSFWRHSSGRWQFAVLRNFSVELSINVTNGKELLLLWNHSHLTLSFDPKREIYKNI